MAQETSEHAANAAAETAGAAAELAEHAVHHEPSMTVTLVFTAILLGMILTLAFEERLHAKKSIITGVYAVLALAFGHLLDVLPFGPVVNVFGESLEVSVNTQASSPPHPLTHINDNFDSDAVAPLHQLLGVASLLVQYFPVCFDWSVMI